MLASPVSVLGPAMQEDRLTSLDVDGLATGCSSICLYTTRITPV